MPVFAQVENEENDWFFETSATKGLTCPLKSINKNATVSSAFSLGKDLVNSYGYSWVNFCKWTPDSKYGMEQHIDETYQLYFTKYGVVVGRNWSSIFTPYDSTTSQPVLIYDYDSSCYSFCDSSNFIPIWQAWSVFSKEFGVKAPPRAEEPKRGEFLLLSEYMKLHLKENLTGLDRPNFHN